MTSRLLRFMIFLCVREGVCWRVCVCEILMHVHPSWLGGMQKKAQAESVDSPEISLARQRWIRCHEFLHCSDAHSKHYSISLEDRGLPYIV